MLEHGVFIFMVFNKIKDEYPYNKVALIGKNFYSAIKQLIK